MQYDTRNRLLGLAVILWAFCKTAGAVTLTAGGQVLNAGDGTSADGGTWTAYDPASAAITAGGNVGTYQPGIWAGEIGVPLNGPAVGMELIALVSRETDSGTQGHQGYYGVIEHILTGTDPAVFGDMTLRPVPVPVATPDPGSTVQITWTAAISDGSAANVSGYHVHRSADGVSFAQITVSPVAGNSFTDNAFPTGTQYYSLSLVFRGDGAPASSLSANSIPVLDTDSDGDPDLVDNCPNDPNADQANFDGDAQGDVCDPDDDNDGHNDIDDAFPLDSSEQSDFDGDGIGDNADPDDDNDGVADVDDQEPFNRMSPIPVEALPSRGGWRVILQ